MSSIRPYSEHDWPQIWGILEPIFRAAETYAVSKDISEQEAKRIWVSGPAATFVIVNEDDYVAGSYYIKPNQPGPGSHVCNCGYVVSSESQGKGLASQMCIHSQEHRCFNGFQSNAIQHGCVDKSQSCPFVGKAQLQNCRDHPKSLSASPRGPCRWLHHVQRAAEC